MKLKKTLIFFLFLLAGILLGSVAAMACEHISFLKWLAFEATIGFGYPNPVSVDLIIMKFAVGFSFQISVAQILCVIISLGLYKGFYKGL